MKTMKVFWCLFFLASCKSKCEEAHIYQLDPLKKIEKNGDVLTEYRYFIVEGFTPKCKIQAKQIEDFAFRNVDQQSLITDSYQLVFYKESDRTNRNFKEDSSDLIEWHGRDIIYVLTWNQGKLISEFQYDNGKIINAPDIQEKKMDK